MSSLVKIPEIDENKLFYARFFGIPEEGTFAESLSDSNTFGIRFSFTGKLLPIDVFDTSYSDLLHKVHTHATLPPTTYAFVDSDVFVLEKPDSSFMESRFERVLGIFSNPDAATDISPELRKYLTSVGGKYQW